MGHLWCQFLWMGVTTATVIALLTEPVNCEQLVKRSVDTTLRSNDNSFGRSLWDGLASKGLAKIESSVRGVFSPVTGLVYLVSLAVGAITILAFYESPISPLPVPPLPNPPVGRFPPENPIWPPPKKDAVPYAQGTAFHPVYSRPYGFQKAAPQYHATASQVIPQYQLQPNSISRQGYDPNHNLYYHPNPNQFGPNFNLNHVQGHGNGNGHGQGPNSSPNINTRQQHNTINSRPSPDTKPVVHFPTPYYPPQHSTTTVAPQQQPNPSPAAANSGSSTEASTTDDISKRVKRAVGSHDVNESTSLKRIKLISRLSQSRLKKKQTPNQSKKERLV